jgi:Family of unknown function (DUF6640)
VFVGNLFARYGGKMLLTIANVATIAGPFGADWNGSHIFNEEWPSHARFHGVVGLGTAIGLAGFSLAKLWGSHDQSARDFAAAVPIVYWGSFFPAALVKGTGLDDASHRVGRIVGIPANVFFATLTSATGVAGWLLDRRSAAS